MWELKLLPLEEITRASCPPRRGSAHPHEPASLAKWNSTAARHSPQAKPTGFQRAAVNSAGNAPAAAASPATPDSTANETSSDLTQSAATGLLVNGSVNNGAASAFAQMAAFGNNRRGPGSLYNGGLGVIFDTSSWDAAPFSLTGIATPKPSYNDVQIVSALGGPLGIPHHLISNSNFFVAYQHAANDKPRRCRAACPRCSSATGIFRRR